MKLSYNWLKEYVDVKASPEEIAHKLTMSGSAVEGINKVGQDTILEFEITSNRPDCLSVTGLAREVAAVFDKKMKMPDFSKPAKTGETKKIKCVIESPDLCQRYTARIISDVKIKEASQSLREKIEAVGIRPVNNVVDITNFCLMELGQPMHAFDLDKIKGNKIIIREAGKNEKITTIDGIERKLNPGMLVIADERGPIAIAGIMGGIETEVGPDTKNIFLESAYFNPVSVRSTARELLLSSESSYRFERGVDKALIEMASSRASKLIIEEAGGRIGNFCETGDKKTRTKKIILKNSNASKILGIPLKIGKAKKILNHLGCSARSKSADILEVSVPSFREDLTREIDLIEEIARIYGFDNIPSKVSKITIQIIRKEKSREIIEKVRKTLVSSGMNEIMTYSLISQEAAERFPSIIKNEVFLNNPLSEEQKVLTPQLLDGMMKAVSYNINRKNKDLKLFEIGKVYSENNGKYIEDTTLSMALTGLFSANWENGKKESTFYDLKGIIEEAFAKFNLEIEIQPGKISGISSGGNVLIKKTGEKIGYIGEASRKTLKIYDIDQKVFIAGINLERITKEAALTLQYKALPRFPFSTRDISLLCDKTIFSGKIKETILNAGKELVKKAELVDIYEGEQIPQDKKSVTYSITYGLDDRTLKEEEIESAHERIKKELQENLKGTIR